MLHNNTDELAEKEAAKQDALQRKLKLSKELNDTAERFLSKSANPADNQVVAITSIQDLEALITTAQEKCQELSRTAFVLSTMPSIKKELAAMELNLDNRRFNDMRWSGVDILNTVLNLNIAMVPEGIGKDEEIKILMHDAKVSVCRLAKALATIDPQDANSLQRTPSADLEAEKIQLDAKINEKLVSILHVDSDSGIETLSFTQKMQTLEKLNQSLTKYIDSVRGNDNLSSYLRELNRDYLKNSSFFNDKDSPADSIYIAKRKWLFVIRFVLRTANLHRWDSALDTLNLIEKNILTQAKILSTITRSEVTFEALAEYKAASLVDKQTSAVPEVVNEVPPVVVQEVPVALEVPAPITQVLPEPTPEKPAVEIKKDEPVPSASVPVVTVVNQTPAEPVVVLAPKPDANKEAIAKLNVLCDNYEASLKAISNDKSKRMQQFVQELRKQIADSPAFDDATKLKNFATVLNQHSTKFNLSNDPETKLFVKHALKILATVLLSISTLGLFAAGCAIYGKTKHGNAKHVWKEPETTRDLFVAAGQTLSK